MQKLMVCFALIIGFASCRASKETPEQKQAAQATPEHNQVQEDAPPQENLPFYDFKTAYESEEVFATLERTPCYGTCPVFKLMILKNGEVYYEGLQHVEYLGRYSTTFTKAEMQQILEKADELGYWKMENEYDTPVTDFPTTFTSLRKGNKVKVIRNRVGGPSELRAFEDFIETLFKKKNLVKIEEN